MAWLFGQGKDTIEWEEFRNDLLFYKHPAKEIKKGARLIIRAGQKAIFYADGVVEGIFEEPGSYDISSEIVPFLSTLKGVFSLRSDTGMRAEVYFVNAKELLLPWGTRQRIMIPTIEAPSGIPIGCNGNMSITFRDYTQFITKIAGVRATFTLSDISERILGELNGILSEAILDGHSSIGINALVALQQNNRKLSKIICAELDKELMDFGLGVEDFNIMGFNYPAEVMKMAEKVAAQSFVGDVGKYAAINMADGLQNSGNGNNMAAMGAQMMMGQKMAEQMSNSMNANSNSKPAPSAAGADKFCPTCRKMVIGKFCSDCGTATV